MLKNLFFDLLHLFFSSFCCSCTKVLKQKNFLPLCEKCLENLEVFHKYNACKVCLNPLLLNGKCFLCEKEPPKNLSLSISAYNEGILQHLFYACKFDGEYSILEIFTHLAMKESWDILHWADAYVPIQSRKKIPFSEECLVTSLIKKISKKTKIPAIKNTLVKIKKDMKVQHFLSESERKENVKNAFTVKNAYKLKNKKRILIVDDIYTTGHTADSAFETIKKYFPKAEIKIFCFLRTPFYP